MLAGIVMTLIAGSSIYGFLVFVTINPKQVNAEVQKIVNSTRHTNDQILPRTFLLDPSLLIGAKQALDSNSGPQISLKQLLLQANSILTRNPTSVVEKRQLPASGDKHDYLSLSPYHWPDPTKPNGLPYILHDGIVNPEVYSIPDIQNLDDMMHRVKILSLAYYFSGNPQYASKAAELLRVWFVNNSTLMNPNLRYAEMAPGKNNGSSSGVMDANNLPDVLDAIGLIQHSPTWTKQDQQGMQLWFSKYLDWLLGSDFGKKEAQAINNHGTWYDVQTSSIALFLNKTDIAKSIVQASMTKLIAAQIQPNGHQPFELRRTNSWDYSLFNLQGLFKLASIGQHLGMDLWNYKNPQGAGLQTALDYLLPYSLKKQTWPYPQIKPINTKNLADLLCQASTHYHDNQSYIRAYKSMNSGNESVTNVDNLLYLCSR